VNVQEYADASAFPETSFTPVVTVTVYVVWEPRADVGVNVAVLSTYDTLPATGDPPAVTRIVDVVIVVMSIRSLNVTWIGALTDTPVAPFDGDGEPGVGATTSAVVNVHEYDDPSAFPETSFTPVVTVTVYVVWEESATVGVNVAVLST